jgi:hypothetical protein
MLKPRILVLVSMILAAAASRLIPHPPNMSSVTAVALFGGAYFSDKRLAFLVPLSALFLSDLVLGFYHHMEVVYLSFALIVAIGLWLQWQAFSPATWPRSRSSRIHCSVTYSIRRFCSEALRSLKGDFLRCATPS